MRQPQAKIERFCVPVCWLLLVASAAGAERAGMPPPPGPGLEPMACEVDLGPPMLTFQSQEGSDSWRTVEPVALTIRSRLPVWRLVMVATPLQGPGAARIEPGALRMRPAGAKPEAMAGAAGLGGPVVVAEVKTGRFGHELSKQFFIETSVDIRKPVGVYEGALQFFFEVGGGAPPAPVGAVRLRLVVEEFVDVRVEGGGLDFGSVGLRAESAREPLRVRVATNASGRDVVFAIRELRNMESPGSFIPGEKIALGLGMSAEKARADCRRNRLGAGALRWRSPAAGVYTLYLDCRIDLTPEITPGHYQGAISIAAGGS